LTHPDPAWYIYRLLIMIIKIIKEAANVMRGGGKMQRMVVWLFLSVFIAAGSAFGAVTSPGGARVETQGDVQQKDKSGSVGESEQIPERVTSENLAYRQIAELRERYGTDKKLSEGGSLSKDELVEAFVAILVKVVEEFKKNGSQTIRRDDMESIRTLIIAMEDELFRKDSYLNIRTSVERLLELVKPAVPIFKYKFGVNGLVRGEGVNNFSLPDLSFTPDHGEGRFVYRVKPYAYWHPANYLDIHLEGQSYGVTGGGKNVSSSSSLYQGFVEARFPDKDSPGVNWVALKAGRQEFVYGSAFILGSDTFFDGLTFDAARIRVQPLPTVTLDLLTGNYATYFSGGIKGNLSGAYLTYGPSDDSSVEVYGFIDKGSEERHAGEHLDILGLRSTSTVGIFAVEYEAVLESGKLFNNGTGENDTVRAAGGHVDMTGQFLLFGYDNAVFMSIAAGSGDKNAANGLAANREFRNPNNDSSLMGDMHVVGDLSGIDVNGHHASGIQAYTLGWGIEVTKKINVSATGRKFIAGSVEDGFSRQLGIETDLNLTYELNKDYTIIVGYDHFFADKFFRDASGSDKGIDYAYTMLVFNYDWTRRKR
jgi:hypothetical protein